ncbi:MAG: hypothetical protein H7840_17090 [Alphaproteobacteria bacterium]
MSVTALVNMALVEVGADPIVDINDGSQNAKMCAARYADIADAILRSHRWNSAMARARIPSSGDPALFGWSWRYPMPTDPWCLRVLEVNGGEPFKAEGRWILTDLAAPLEVLYIARITPEVMDPLLKRAIAMSLGAAIAFRLTSLGGVAERLATLANSALREARSIDAQEGTPDDVVADEFIGARR